MCEGVHESVPSSLRPSCVTIAATCGKLSAAPRISDAN